MFGISSKPPQRWSLYFLQTLRRIQSLLSPMNITDNITLLHTNTLLSLRPLLSTLAPFPHFLLLMTTWARVFLHCWLLARSLAAVSAQPRGQFSHKADWIHSYSPPLFLLSLFCALAKEKGWSNEVSSPHTHTLHINGHWQMKPTAQRWLEEGMQYESKQWWNSDRADIQKHAYLYRCA